jgi:hypothetical protein
VWTSNFPPSLPGQMEMGVGPLVLVPAPSGLTSGESTFQLDSLSPQAEGVTIQWSHRG